jgi:hypothetical protein
MAKKRYRVYRDGGQTGQQPSALNKFVEGGMTSDDQQMQLIMQTIYSMVKEQGLDKTAILARLQSTGLPSDFLLKAIDGVYSYMNSIGESFDVDDSFNAIAPSGDDAEQPTEDQGADQMQQMQDMSMEVASEDDDEALDIAMSDEMRYGGEPNQYQGLNRYFQAGGEQTEQQEPTEVYFPNMDIMTSTEDTPYMKDGGMTKKKFMKNILKRFEEGGEEDESVKLQSADKKDTPEGSVKKYTQGFLGAVKNKATTAETEKLYKLAKQSGDPKLMQILGENPEQGQGQPMQPMAKYGMQKYQDKGEVTYGPPTEEDVPDNFVEKQPMSAAEWLQNAVQNSGTYEDPAERFNRESLDSLRNKAYETNIERLSTPERDYSILRDGVEDNTDTGNEWWLEDTMNMAKPRGYYQDGGGLPAYQKKGEVASLDDYINTMLDFETRQGSRTGGYLPNYGINIPKYTDPAKYGTKYDYLADGVTGEDARKFIMSEYYNEGIENFDPSVAGRLIDYRYNTGRNYKDFLLLNQGLINLDEIASGDPAVRTRLDKLYTKNEADLIAAMGDEGYLKKFDQTRDELAKDFQARKLKTNPNYGDPYGKSWHDRSTIYSGLDYAKLKEAEERGLLTREEVAKIIKEGESGKDYVMGDPRYNYVTRGQDPSYYGYHNMFEFLFPGNFNYPGGQKYTAPSSWGKPVARDVYKTRSMGWNKGQPKKWIEYYEVPEGMDPEDMTMIRPKDMRRAGRKFRKNLNKAYRRDGIEGASNVFRNAMNAVSGNQGEEEEFVPNYDDPTSENFREKDPYKREQLYPSDRLPVGGDQGPNEMDRKMRINLGIDKPDEYYPGGRPRSRASFKYGGLAKAQFGISDVNNIMKGVNAATQQSLQVKPNAPINSNAVVNNEGIIGNDPGLSNLMTSFNTPMPTNPNVAAANSDPTNFSNVVSDPTQAGRSLETCTEEQKRDSTSECYCSPEDRQNPDNEKCYEGEKKKQYVGFKNRSKNQRRLGRDAQLGLLNNTANMVLGLGEDVNQSWDTSTYAANNLNNPMEINPIVNQKGDYTTQGDFRPDQQGFTNSANNPGYSKYGGALRNGDVRELTLDEIRKIMDEGGQIEFI